VTPHRVRDPYANEPSGAPDRQLEQQHQTG
jgi:hypothetical protein